MSESNTQSSSGAQPSNDESNSGIVITGGLDSPDQKPESPSPTDEEMEPEVEEEPEEEAESVEESVEESEEVTEEQASESEIEQPEQEVDAEPEASVDDGEADANEDGAEEEEAPAVDSEAEAEPVEEEESVSSNGDVNAAEGAEPEAVEDEGADSVSEDEEAEAEAVEEADAEAVEEADTDDESEAGAEDESVGVEEVNHPPKHLNATVKASELDDFTSNVSVLVDECKIRTSPDGLRVRAVDPANVGMVDAELNAEAFEGFDTTNGVLGVNLDRFEEVISLADSGDLVTLDYNTETRKLHIATNGVEYTLALIDPDSIRQEPEIPALELPCELEVESSDINRGIKAADMVSDHIAFKTERAHSGDQFIIEAEGDTDDVELELGNDDLVSSSIGGDVASLFSLEYMKDIKKALPTNGSVGMELGNEFPVKLRFSNEEETQNVEFMLAPRINSD